jgi:multidrug efflux system outer membrane protein
VTGAFTETTTVLYAREKIAASLQQLTRTANSYREMVRLSTLRYNTGLASYFEVLYAMQLLYPAETARVISQVNLLVDYVNIYKALGGGWNLQPDDPNPTWFSPAANAAPPPASP